MASETVESLTGAPFYWASPSRLSINLDVRDEHTVVVSGLVLRDLVDRLQRDHETDLLMISNQAGTSVEVDVDNLSDREAEIVRLITLGMSNRDIAGTLFLSVNTVKTYIRSAYRKMGVGTRSQAVMWGVQHGFTMQDFSQGADPR
jgi:DNA-binding NarL/FixJ family response regulator